MSNFLNGIEIIEMDVGGRTITTPSTSVIGLVGTASMGKNASKTIDQVLPLNKPVLFTSIQQLKELELSDIGTIPQALYSIYNQTSAIVSVVRIEEVKDKDGDIDEEATIANAAGSATSYTGVYALMLAETELKVKPKLLLCPYFSSLVKASNKPNNIVSSLTAVAEKLRAVAIIDGTNTTRGDVIDLASNVANSRLMIMDPAYVPAFTMEDVNSNNCSSSPLLAGVFAKNDATKGFW